MQKVFFVDFQLSVEFQPEDAVKLKNKGRKGNLFQNRFPSGVSSKVLDGVGLLFLNFYI